MTRSETIEVTTTSLSALVEALREDDFLDSRSAFAILYYKLFQDDGVSERVSLELSPFGRPQN